MAALFATREDRRVRARWPTTTFREAIPESVGLSSAVLAAADAYASANSSNALMVMRNGFLCFEKYYSGSSATTIFDGKSMAKSLVSLAVGAAIRNGLLPSIDARIADYLGPAPNNPYFADLTLRHCLTMTSGIASPSFGAMIATSYWAGYVLNAVGAHPPGTTYIYSAVPQLVSSVIGQVAGQPLRDFLIETVMDPIGVGDFTWPGDPAGDTDGNGGALMTARQMAKVGLLMASDGLWDGERLLPRGWVTLSSFPCLSSVRTPVSAWDAFEVTLSAGVPTEEGLLWWCRKFDGVPGDSFFAFGGNGTFIVVIPSLDLTVTRCGTGPLPRPDEDFLAGLLCRIAGAVL